MALIKVSAAEVRLNRPIPYAIYSNSGKLLLNEGQCIQTERQLERIFSEGAFRDDRAPACSPRGPGSGMPGGARVHEPAAASLKSAPAPAEPATKPGEFPKLPPAFEGFQLTPEGEESGAVAVTFIGAIHGQGLLVNAPGCDALQPGVAVDGRLLFGRDVYAFRTRVASRSADFAGVVLLDYPHGVRRHPVRRHRRVPTAIPAQVVRNDTQQFQAQLVDVSVEGVGLKVAHCCVQPGEHFRLALRLTVQDRTHSLLLNCIARNIRAQKNGDFLVGAQLNVAAAETRALLRAFVFEAATGTAM